MQRNDGIKIAIGTALLCGLSLIFKQGIKYRLGNADKYSVKNVEEVNDSKLVGKRIIFLGSSVTYGSASEGESFVDYLKKKYGILAVKEAVGGTTLVDEELRGKKSYIARMKTIDKDIKADAFVCQLSTNDATVKKPLGIISDSFNKESFDTKTITGAIEYVIAYAKETWNCPILFYTCTKYKSDLYEKMVNQLYEIQKKWDIEILDLWHDIEMNQVSKLDYELYMVNPIHPSKAGYLHWWTPKFEEELKEIL